MSCFSSTQLFPPPPPPPLTSSASLLSSPPSPLILPPCIGASDRSENFSDGISRGVTPSCLLAKARGGSGGIVRASSPPSSILAPSPMFLGHPPLLSLIADRTHDFWAKSFANNNLLAPTTNRLFPPPPPLFPFAAAAVSGASEAAPTLPLTLTPNWETLQVL